MYYQRQMVNHYIQHHNNDMTYNNKGISSRVMEYYIIYKKKKYLYRSIDYTILIMFYLYKNLKLNNIIQIYYM